jgi:hypothetical protein
MRRFFGSLAGKLVVSGAVFVLSVASGWVMGRVYPPPNTGDRLDVKECRDEVWSIDNARGPASCSRNDMASEIKDGYLVCRCKGGKR